MICAHPDICVCELPKCDGGQRVALTMKCDASEPEDLKCEAGKYIV